MTEINIKNFLDFERRALTYYTIHFKSRYDPIVETPDFKHTYGIYKPACHSFKVYADHIEPPNFPTDYLKTVETITLEDCMLKNYEPLEIIIDNEGVHKVINGRHRLLRILLLCLENKISLDDFTIKCTVIT